MANRPLTIVRRPVLGRLDQGLIFTCAYAEDYPTCQVWAVTITARCDIEHDKAHVFNYLPIVRLTDWLHHDGKMIVCSRALRQTNGQLKTILTQSGFSPTILESQTPLSIHEKLFANPSTQQARKASDRFRALAEWHSELCAIERGEPPLKKGRSLLVESESLTRSLLAELTANNLNGFYFLPKIDPDGDDDGFVVMLREVRHIPRSLARLVAIGLPRAQYEDLSTRDATLSGRLSFRHDDFAMPIGILSSPALEHLVQCFAYLFSRIGVPDLPQDYIASLLERGTEEADS